MIRNTSIETYKQIQNEGLLSKRRFQVYNVLYNNGPLTGAQVAVRVKKLYGSWGQSETIRNRITELRDAGVVTELNEVICPVSGRKVILWATNNNLPSKAIKKHLTKNEIIEHLKRENRELRQIVFDLKDRLGEMNGSKQLKLL